MLDNSTAAGAGNNVSIPELLSSLAYSAARWCGGLAFRKRSRNQVQRQKRHSEFLAVDNEGNSVRLGQRNSNKRCRHVLAHCFPAVLVFRRQQFVVPGITLQRRIVQSRLDRLHDYLCVISLSPHRSLC
jgi:hypothetical protein